MSGATIAMVVNNRSVKLHFYAPAPVSAHLRRLDCPTCKRSRFGLSTMFEWYSGTLTCLGCGESWNEDGRCKRPFRRGWRKEAIAQARKGARAYRATFSTPVRWRDA